MILAICVVILLALLYLSLLADVTIDITYLALLMCLMMLIWAMSTAIYISSTTKIYQSPTILPIHTLTSTQVFILDNGRIKEIYPKIVLDPSVNTATLIEIHYTYSRPLWVTWPIHIVEVKELELHIPLKIN